MHADIKAKYAAWFGMDRPVAVRGCDHHGCPEAGLHKAPKSRANLYGYYWFCLEHVRRYNAAWDFYAGMSTQEIEKAIRFDTVWQRETWPLGDWNKREEEARQKMRAEFFGDAMHTRPDAVHETSAPPATNLPPHVKAALAALDMDVTATLGDIKIRYKKLAKQHHPDANGGSREAEEKIKSINQAFTTLKVFFAGE